MLKGGSCELHSYVDQVRNQHTYLARWCCLSLGIVDAKTLAKEVGVDNDRKVRGVSHWLGAGGIGQAVGIESENEEER